MIHIYYGMGKGKTSTLNGSAVRAAGSGMKVLLVRFLKGRETAEDSLLEKIGIKIMRAQVSPKFVFQMDPMEKLQTRDHVNQVLKYIKFNAKNYDVILLDEYLDLAADTVKMFTPKQLVDAIEDIDAEIMISGHTHIDSLFSKADLITKYEAEKHYFDKGVKARKGIEF